MRTLGPDFHQPLALWPRPSCRRRLSATLPVSRLPGVGQFAGYGGHFAGYGLTETAAAGGARLEGQRLVESGPSVLIGFVIGINRN